MEVITYSLRDDQMRSDQYYLDIAAYTDIVVNEAQMRLGQPIESFQTFLSNTGREQLRSTPEYLLELLMLGVLWKVYASRSGSLPYAPQQALVGLVSLRKKNARLKPLADGLRGLLNGLFLWSGDQSMKDASITISALDHLLSWLSASGDFPQEVQRLSAWRDFLRTLPPDQLASHLAAVRNFADWFERSSLERLGRYTPNVERFLAETRPRYRWRRDAILCGRQRLEYHLNMVGTEILNRAFRESFLRTERKALFLPPCMKAKPDSECQATATPVGERCAGCTPGCRVHQLTKLGEKHGFQVFMLPDDLATLSTNTAKSVTGAKLGVVGVSCVLTNTSGGWETRLQRIPAQGVPLDYCGCSYHWHKQGIPTDINLPHLLQIMGIDGHS
jgi:hypothetical protein